MPFSSWHRFFTSVVVCPMLLAAMSSRIMSEEYLRLNCPDPLRFFDLSSSSGGLGICSQKIAFLCVLKIGDIRKLRMAGRSLQRAYARGLGIRRRPARLPRLGKRNSKIAIAQASQDVDGSGPVDELGGTECRITEIMVGPVGFCLRVGRWLAGVVEKHPDNPCVQRDRIEGVAQELACNALLADVVAHVGEERIHPNEIGLMLLDQPGGAASELGSGVDGVTLENEVLLRSAIISSRVIPSGRAGFQHALHHFSHVAGVVLGLDVEAFKPAPAFFEGEMPQNLAPVPT